ncbi:MAG: bifunctional diaminohydroxyphosphoribosylaminopyrimidine deaminase/5-amino-6-(5-phosphoribosylamino)uracil reductase RibD [Gemmatimonadota bacterium]|nr:bifunctional diaminohydroxyphosphoribosylaminopyrimidine deaminase/5-amino-6-(5-phosphoribosylamino)uracil reductase RibD [Gemmatimonadota bacterium]
MAVRDATGSTLSASDGTWLLRAAGLAERGWGWVHPNPMVGCVLVKDGKPVGEGSHREYGGAHAEVEAVTAAGKDARGATAYISLEPCNHHGKTPPCTELLLDAGVVRVVFGALDSGLKGGGGAQRLAKAGMEVAGPSDDPRLSTKVDPVYFHTIQHSGSYVVVKLAESRDYGIAARPGERTFLTGRAATREVHRLRMGFDGILIGGLTARVDDPRLTLREGFQARVPPTRIVLDPGAELSTDARLFQTIDEAPLIIVVTPTAPRERVRFLEEAGAKVEVVPASPPGLDLQETLTRCWSIGLRSIFCEGGGRLARALVDADLVQRLYLLRTPHVLGPQCVPGLSNVLEEGRISDWSVVGEPRQFGNDVLVTYDREE